MGILRKIRPVRKGRWLMTHIYLATSKPQLRKWRNKNRRRFKTIFYGSPRKDKKGWYALASK